MHPDLKMTKLTKPVAINVANEDAVLQGIALQDIPITWGPGKSSVHTMLVVPKLAWHVLFGNNHLEATDAIVKHQERIVSFTHPQMKFAIKCPREPPVRPSGRVETNVVSLSAVVETPKKLSPGINIIKVCVIVATIGSMILSPALSPSRRREAPCEGTNSPRLFTPGETKALAKSKVHQISRAWVNVRGWSSSLISKIWRIIMNSEHCDWSNLKFAL